MTFQELGNNILGDRLSLLRLYQLGLDYMDICMPFLHHPTLDMSSLPSLLVLAICSLGACISDEYDAREIGRMIHSHVWSKTFMVYISLPAPYYVPT
jgi:hypothetical protein